MAVTDSQTIDGIAYDDNATTLVLEIYDHLNFDGKFEFDHLAILQDKLNSYIWFINSKQYEETYPNKRFSKFIINIHFLNAITENCKKYIENANIKLSAFDIHIVAISDKQE